MNILYMKYALEIAACGSLNKAAEKLYVGQPNLSRAVKELESSLGVTIFERSARGMEITPDGEVFLKYAKNILSQIDSLENLFKNDTSRKKRFSIAVPRASYISEAFAAFSDRLTDEPNIEAFYKETNSVGVIKSVQEEEYKLGIVRYAENFDKYYKENLEEKGMYYELVTEFRYVLLMSEQSPLARLKSISFDELQSYTEIAHADPYVPSLPFSEVKKEELPEINRRIYVFERGSQFDLLSSNPNTFMWVSPVPEKLLKRYGLVQRVCDANAKVYKDVMIYRDNYKLTDLDKAFISELCKVKREVLSFF